MNEPDERHSNQGRKGRALRVWERLSWPQVAALAIVILGLLGFAHALPASTWENLDWMQIASVVASLFGVGGLATGGSIFRGRDGSQ